MCFKESFSYSCFSEATTFSSSEWCLDVSFEELHIPRFAFRFSYNLSGEISYKARYSTVWLEVRQLDTRREPLDSVTVICNLPAVITLIQKITVSIAIYLTSSSGHLCDRMSNQALKSLNSLQEHSAIYRTKIIKCEFIKNGKRKCRSWKASWIWSSHKNEPHPLSKRSIFST